MLDFIPNLGTRLGISPEDWDLLHPESRAMVRSACLRKKAYPLRNDAISKVLQARQNGAILRAYPCPFVLVGEDHFHVGHVPTMKVVAMIARTIRDLHHNRPPTLPKGTRRDASPVGAPPRP